MKNQVEVIHIKKILKKLFKHSTLFLTVISLVLVVGVNRLFEEKAINYSVAVLFTMIILVIIATLIKIKILESRGDK